MNIIDRVYLQIKNWLIENITQIEQRIIGQIRKNVKKKQKQQPWKTLRKKNNKTEKMVKQNVKKNVIVKNVLNEYRYSKW